MLMSLISQVEHTNIARHVQNNYTSDGNTFCAWPPIQPTESTYEGLRKPDANRYANMDTPVQQQTILVLT